MNDVFFKLSNLSIAVRTMGAVWVSLAILATPAWAAPAAKSGDGTMSVSPTTAVAGSAGSFTLSFRNANRGPFNAGSQLELSIPTGWTAPQSSNPGVPGFVGIASTAGVATASIASISGSGPWAVLIDFTADKGAANGFDLRYAGATPSATGTHLFATRTRQAGGSFVALGTSPSIAVTKAQAGVTLGNLLQTCDGTPRAATVDTVPAGLTVAVTYDGQTQAPIEAGAYAVVAEVVDAIYEGSATGTLVVQEAGGEGPTIGLETFDHFGYTGSTYAAGSFLGQDGSVWTYANARGDLSISGRSPTLDKAKNAFLQSGAIPGGVGTLSLKYRKAGIQNVACGVFVNGTQVGTVAGGDGTVQTWTSGELNVAGNVELLITNNVNSGAITVDDVEWSGYMAPATVALGDLDQTYDGTPRSATATTEPAGLAIEMTYDGSDLVPTDAGMYAVVATIVDGTFAGSASGTLSVAMADQSIDFPPIEDQWNTNVVALAATASSGLPVGYAVTEGPAAIDGLQLSFTGTGQVSVVASQAGDGNWNPAADVVRSFAVSRRPCIPVISSTAVNVREGGEGRFFVRLDRAPEGPVVVEVNRAEGDEALFAKSGAALTFGPLDWNWWQAVTLAAAEDENADGETATFRISTPDAPDGFVVATALDDDVGENLALAAGGSEIAGTAAARCAMAIDGISVSPGNYGYTIWTNVPCGTMTLNLNSTARVSRVRILNWNWLYPVVHRYRIESSLDGVDWSILVDASGSEHSGWDDWVVGDRLARYLRFVGLSNSANSVVCIPEWEVYGDRNPMPQPVLSQTNVNVREGGEGRFYVRLDCDPGGRTVAVDVQPFSGEADVSVKSGATRIFTSDNWNVWQAVALGANEDVNSINETALFRIATPEVPAQYLEATALDDDVGANLALASAGATIGGVNALRPAMAIDGIHADRANYAGTTYLNVEPDGTMTLDLQAATELGRIRLLNWDWAFRTQRYTIESSLDGEIWTPLVDAGTGEHIGWEDWEVSATARYLRFKGLYNSANMPVLVAEWEVYGPPPERRDLAPEMDGMVVAESEPISVLTSDGLEDETGWNAVDGDEATAWVGQKPGGGYIVVEYGPSLSLSGLEIDVTEASLTEVQILTSLDAKDWQPLPEDLEANPVSLNFLWLLFPDNGTDAVPEVIEIRPNP